MKHLSPLRYPGGKACLARFLSDIIDLSDLRGCDYYEPFAGGAGAALSLLKDNVVQAIHINDADVRIFSFWMSVLNETERFVERIAEVPLSIDQWRQEHAICDAPEGHDVFSIGFAAFYMNRCNRSGVLTGAGPIGGYEQAGRWRLDARFSRQSLIERVVKLGRLRDRIHVSGMDAIRFLIDTLPRGRARRNVFVYLDPPYVKKGQKLYMNSYIERDHRALCNYVQRQTTLPWLMSYDNAPLIRELYAGYRQALLPIQYSLQTKRTANELIVAPETIVLPTVCRRGQYENRLQDIA